MTRHVLEGGTDVAEVAIFSKDDLPDDHADGETAQALESRSQLFRFPTGADGGYLLHLFVDENIPDALLACCATGDKKEQDIVTTSGQIAFGGIESAYSSFKPNPAIRTDVEIPAGRYHAEACHTEYPDDYIEQQVAAAIGAEGAALLGFPAKIIGGAVVLVIVSLCLAFALSKLFLIGAGLVMLCAFLWFRRHTSAESYRKLDAEKSRVERDYPSIVVRMMKRED